MFVPEILFEDNHLLVVRKPCGLLTQGDRSGSPNLLDLLKAFIKERDNKPGKVFLGMVQRLDKPVSGLILFAKTSKAASRISEQIRKKQLDKIYLAVTSSANILEVETGEWQSDEKYLLRNRGKTIISAKGVQGSQQAVLQRKMLCRNSHYAFHLIRLVTGRKHQIRAQLSSDGLVIAGDKKYGSRAAFSVPGGIALHAWYCGFSHPTLKERVELVSTVPKELLNYFSAVEQQRIKENIKLLSPRFSSFT